MRSITGLARAALSAFSPDVAHAHFGHHAWFYLPVLKAMNLPLVVSFYGHDMSELPRIKPMWRRRYTELFSYGQLFFCEGPAMAAGLERLGCPAPRIRVKRLGVDCDKRVVSPRKFEVGEELKVLVVARMTEKKGIPDAVRAVAAASRHIPIKLTIVGDAAPGSKGRREEKRILEAISACRLEAFVNLTGRVAYTNLVRLALQHDVLLQPSRTSSTGDTEGGIPVSLIELGATGMAAVATRHADIPEVVRDGENGFLTDEGDIEGLASALIRLATTPGLVGAMGTAMACWLEREFSQKECHARLIDLYREALRA